MLNNAARGRVGRRVWAGRVPGALLVVGAVVSAVGQWGVLAAAHPAHLVLLGVVAVVGIAVVLRVRRWVWPSWALVVVLLGVSVWLRPFGAVDVSVPGGVAVDDRVDVVYLRPGGEVRDGVVFFPGARVDHRAYLPLLGRLAGEGTLVAVVKAPLEVAFLSGGAAAEVMDANPGVGRWTLAGHSLGGVVAAQQVGDPRVAGLLLWASYPSGDLSGEDRLTVGSVYGENDTFTTVRDIEESRSRLPADTRFVPVPGGVHGYFGDYGGQPGDGVAGVGRDEAQERIVAASKALLEDVRAGT